MLKWNRIDGKGNPAPSDKEKDMFLVSYSKQYGKQYGNDMLDGYMRDFCLARYMVWHGKRGWYDKLMVELLNVSAYTRFNLPE